MTGIKGKSSPSQQSPCTAGSQQLTFEQLEDNVRLRADLSQIQENEFLYAPLDDKSFFFDEELPSGNLCAYRLATSSYVDLCTSEIENRRLHSKILSQVQPFSFTNYGEAEPWFYDIFTLVDQQSYDAKVAATVRGVEESSCEDKALAESYHEFQSFLSNTYELQSTLDFLFEQAQSRDYRGEAFDKNADRSCCYCLPFSSNVRIESVWNFFRYPLMGNLLTGCCAEKSQITEEATYRLCSEDEDFAHQYNAVIRQLHSLQTEHQELKTRLYKVEHKIPYSIDDFRDRFDDVFPCNIFTEEKQRAAEMMAAEENQTAFADVESTIKHSQERLAVVDKDMAELCRVKDALRLQAYSWFVEKQSLFLYDEDDNGQSLALLSPKVLDVIESCKNTWSGALLEFIVAFSYKNEHRAHCDTQEYFQSFFEFIKEVSGHDLMEQTSDNNEIIFTSPFNLVCLTKAQVHMFFTEVLQNTSKWQHYVAELKEHLRLNCFDYVSDIAQCTGINFTSDIADEILPFEDAEAETEEDADADADVEAEADADADVEAETDAETEADADEQENSFSNRSVYAEKAEQDNAHNVDTNDIDVADEYAEEESEEFVDAENEPEQEILPIQEQNITSVAEDMVEVANSPVLEEKESLETIDYTEDEALCSAPIANLAELEQKQVSGGNAHCIPMSEKHLEPMPHIVTMDDADIDVKTLSAEERKDFESYHKLMDSDKKPITASSLFANSIDPKHIFEVAKTGKGTLLPQEPKVVEEPKQAPVMTQLELLQAQEDLRQEMQIEHRKEKSHVPESAITRELKAHLKEQGYQGAAVESLAQIGSSLLESSSEQKIDNVLLEHNKNIVFNQIFAQDAEAKAAHEDFHEKVDKTIALNSYLRQIKDEVNSIAGKKLHEQADNLSEAFKCIAIQELQIRALSSCVEQALVALSEVSPAHQAIQDGYQVLQKLKETNERWQHTQAEENFMLMKSKSQQGQSSKKDKAMPSVIESYTDLAKQAEAKALKHVKRACKKGFTLLNTDQPGLHCEIDYEFTSESIIQSLTELAADHNSEEHQRLLALQEKRQQQKSRPRDMHVVPIGKLIHTIHAKGLALGWRSVGCVMNEAMSGEYILPKALTSVEMLDVYNWLGYCQSMARDLGPINDSLVLDQMKHAAGLDYYTAPMFFDALPVLDKMIEDLSLSWTFSANELCIQQLRMPIDTSDEDFDLIGKICRLSPEEASVEDLTTVNMFFHLLLEQKNRLGNFYSHYTFPQVAVQPASLDSKVLFVDKDSKIFLPKEKCPAIRVPGAVTEGNIREFTLADVYKSQVQQMLPLWVPLEQKRDLSEIIESHRTPSVDLKLEYAFHRAESVTNKQMELPHDTGFNWSAKAEESPSNVEDDLLQKAAHNEKNAETVVGSQESIDSLEPEIEVSGDYIHHAAFMDVHQETSSDLEEPKNQSMPESDFYMPEQQEPLASASLHMKAEPVPTAPVAPVVSTAPVAPVASPAPVVSVASTAPVAPVASTASVAPVASPAPVASTASVAPVAATAPLYPKETVIHQQLMQQLYSCSHNNKSAAQQSVTQYQHSKKQKFQIPMVDIPEDLAEAERLELLQYNERQNRLLAAQMCAKFPLFYEAHHVPEDAGTPSAKSHTRVQPTDSLVGTDKTERAARNGIVANNFFRSALDQEKYDQEKKKQVASLVNAGVNPEEAEHEVARKLANPGQTYISYDGHGDVVFEGGNAYFTEGPDQVNPIKELSLPPEYRFFSKDQTFSNFIVSPESDCAVAGAWQVAHNLGNPANNPFYLCGPSGSGKSHLLNAIINSALSQNPDLNICTIHAQDFISLFVRSTKTIVEHNRFNGPQIYFKDMFSSCDILVIDCFHAMYKAKGSLNALTEIINKNLTTCKCQVILLTQETTSEMVEKGVNPTLISRVTSGLCCTIGKMDYSTSIYVLNSMSHDTNLPLRASVISFMARHFDGNGAAMHGAMKTLKCLTYNRGRTLNYEEAMKIVRPLVFSKDVVVHERDIVTAVSRVYGISVAEMRSKSRRRQISSARATAMALMRELLPEMSLRDIGNSFKRDHTSVLAAIRKVKQAEKEQFSDLATKLVECRKELNLKDAA